MTVAEVETESDRAGRGTMEEEEVWGEDHQHAAANYARAEAPVLVNT